MKAYRVIFTLWLMTLLLSGCVSAPSFNQRVLKADTLAKSHHWQASQLKTQHFDLLFYQPQHLAQHDESILTIYIEGDGLAWLTKRKVSPDPTPINHAVLKMAINHPQDNVVYLARPCQYTGGTTARNCNKHIWTDARFSEQVIAANNEALDQLKVIFSAKKLQLIGYSGGGAVAALLAARRNDVFRLITIAGNLDHQAWTQHHKISPLLHSLNPADYRQQLAAIKQIHFVGMQDKVIPPFLVNHFVTGFPKKTKARVIDVSDQTHCCWYVKWRDDLVKILDEY